MNQNYYLCGMFGKGSLHRRKKFHFLFHIWVLGVLISLLLPMQLSAQDVPAPQPIGPPAPPAPTQIPEEPAPASVGTPSSIYLVEPPLTVAPKPKRRPIRVDSTRVRDSLLVVAAALPEDSAVVRALPLLPGNPFDLVFRLSAQQLAASDTSKLLRDSTFSSGGNPFEVRSAIAASPTKSKPLFGSRQFKPLVLERNKSIPLFALIVSMLLFLGLSLSLNSSTVSTMYGSLLNDSVMRINFKEQSSFKRTPYYMLYVAFMVNAAIFIYLLVLHYKLAVTDGHLKALGLSFLLVIVAFPTKLVLLRFIGWILPLYKEISFYRFIIITFAILMGLVLATANFFIAFSEPTAVDMVIRITLIVLGFLFMMRTIRSLFLVQNLLGQHLLHFLLYFCAVEIAPLAILIRLLVDR